MIRPLAGVARLELLRLLRSPMALALLLVVPAFQVMLFGYAIRPSDGAITVAIAAPSHDEAERLAELLRHESNLTVSERRIAPARASDAVAAGRALVGIDLPVQRSFDNPDAPTLPIRITIDGIDAPLARSAISRITALYWQSRAERDRFAERRPGLVVVTRNNPKLRDSWTFLPALSGVVVMIATLMLGCLSIAREREGGTWETLGTMPISRLNLICGKLLPGTVIGTLQGCAVMLIAHRLFAVPLPPGSAVLMIAVLPVFAAAHLALGLAISMRAATQLSALQGAVGFYLPAMLLSGFLYPVATLPRWAQVLGSVFPLTHYVRAARLAILADRDWTAVIGNVWPIAAFLIIAILAATTGRRV